MLALPPFMVPSRRRLLPKRRHRPPDLRDSSAAGTAVAAAGAGFHGAAALAPPASSWAVGRRRVLRPSAPTAPRFQVRRPGLAPNGVGGGRRRAETRSEALQVRSTPVETARRCPQVRRPGRRRSLSCPFVSPAWVARGGAAPRDRRRVPLGKGGAAARLPVFLQSWVLPARAARALAATTGATGFPLTT